MLLHHVCKVDAQLVGAGKFVKAGIQASAVDGVPAQRHRIHAIKGRGLVQTHEQICVEPVPSRRVAPVDQRDARVAMREHRIGDGHARGASTDDQVIRFNQLRHLISF